MKKLYALCLLLTLMLVTGLKASAVTATFEWDIPGSVKIQTGSTSGPFVELGADQTSYVFETSAILDYVYIYAADGYALVNAVTTDGSKTFTPSTWGTTKLSFTVNASLDGKTIKVNCKKFERNETFTIDIVNGLDALTAEFYSGYKLDLKAGKNTYYFDSEIDKQALTFYLSGATEAYSFTLDGAPVEKNKYFARYPVTVTDGCEIVVQVYENASDEPTDCTLTFQYSEGMEGCISNVRNFSTSSFVDVVNNSVEVKGNNDIQVNLITGDYTYTKFTLNGVDITDKFKTGRIRFTVPDAETATLLIEGTATVYGNIDFTGYISGAEGVEFSLTYGGDAITTPEGEAITEDITVGDYTLTPENAEKFTIPVSEKVGKLFFRPKAGYYIAELYSKLGSAMEQHGSNAAIVPDTDGTTFYMVVEKLEDPYTFNLNTTGTSYTAKLSSANTQISDSWDNPGTLSKWLSKGQTSISFIPGYELPLVIAVTGDDTNNPAAYLDGAPLTAADNSDSNTKDFTFTPYFPVEGDGIAAGTKSDVQLYLSTDRPTMSGASLTLNDGVEAEFFYSPVRHTADPAGQQVISGPTMTVKPSSTDVVITYKGEPVELDANGEFTFKATGNPSKNIVNISLAPKFAEMLVDPADGATVKTLSQIKVTLPCIDPNFESMLDANEDVLSQIVVKNGDEVVATFGEPGEATGDDEGNNIYPIILSAPVTEAGTYTIEIPEKAFIEKKWSDADDAFVAVANGFVTPSYTGTVTVDPTMVSVCDNYTLDPESESTVSEISVVKVTFPGITAEEYFETFSFSNATFTNGETTIQAIVNYDWMSESEYRVMTVTPMNDEEEAAPITEPGTWTMTIEANTFAYNGETNSEITAVYTIEASTTGYIITPATGSAVDNLAEITIEFPGVTEVEYNDIAITLVGAEYDATSTEVRGTGNTRTVSFRNPATEGEYTVTFPAGAFTLDGKPSEEATATYTFSPIYRLNPESGSTLEKFEVAISFPEATNVEFVGDSYSIVLTNGHSYASPEMSCVKDETASVPTFLLTIPESAQQPPLGKFDLIIEEGVFTIDGKGNPAIFAEYTLDYEVSTDYVVTPQNGVIIYQEYGYDFSFIFDESARVSRPDTEKIHIAFEGETVPTASYEVMNEGNMLLFMITDTEYCKPGVLTVNIDEGAFNIGTTPNPAVNAQWNVIAPKTFEASITPTANDEDTKLENIETIYISFPDATSGEVYNEYGASLSSKDYSYYETGSIEIVDAPAVQADDALAGVTFAINFKKTTAAGTYTLSVREGTFTLDGVHNSPELSAIYYVDPNVSGIANIVADENGNVTVYGIDGRVVLENAPAAEVRGLKKGLYIINGVKVYLK